MNMTYHSPFCASASEHDDAPLPFELYTEEELEEMQNEKDQDDWERSIPSAAERNRNLK